MIAAPTNLSDCLQQSYTDNSGKRIRTTVAFKSAIKIVDEKHTRSRLCCEPVQVVQNSNREIVIKLDQDCPMMKIKNASLSAADGAVIKSQILLATAGNSITILLIHDLLHGYYTLVFEVNFEGKWNLVRQLIICSPSMAWTGSNHETKNVLAIQLYALCSSNNWGIGDFSDLKNLSSKAEIAGYDLLALNPLHMTHIDETGEYSPYSPTSRLLLNWLYIDIQSLTIYQKHKEQLALDWPHKEGLADTVQRLRCSVLVDYDHVAKVKFWVLSKLAKYFWNRYECDENFASLFQKFLQSNECRIINQIRINEARLSEHEQSLRFHLFTQYCCEQQLQECFPKEGGIQPIFDLAIGVKPDSLEVSANQQCYISTMSLGAPPDAFNEAGQVWNIAPFDPVSLRQQFYQPLIDLLRANMPTDGGIRIDHVMWLTRQYWAPVGSSAVSGGYVRFEVEEILAILRLESVRRRCLVIGEDLGTVPRGFRNLLISSGVFLMDVLPFSTSFSEMPNKLSLYSPMIAAFVGTHDMPMFRAIWSGSHAGNLLNTGLVSQKELPVILEKQAHLKASFADGMEMDDDEIESPDAFCLLNKNLRSRRPAFLFTLLDDLLGETLPINIPGTVDEYPNWRRKHSLDVEEFVLNPV